MNHASQKFGAVVITGPTAVGKTDVALALAESVPSEIVSADSRQIYRFMDIGTAKPTAEQLRFVPHHFIDICNPDEVYSAGEYGRAARECVLQIQQREKLPIIVGGSGLYLRALLEGFSEPLPSNRAVQEELKKRAGQEGSIALHAELARVDPLSAQRLHPNDVHRIVRALEVFYAEHASMHKFWETPSTPAPFAYRVYCLHLERRVLYERINRRVEKMLAAGLVEECRGLLARGFKPQHNALQTVGYREVFSYLSGEIDELAMQELIQRHTRQYAKRQLTWFRKMAGCEWIGLNEGEEARAVAARIGIL